MMKINKKIKRIFLITGFCFLVSLGSSFVSDAVVTSESIKEKENQINSVENEKKKLQAGLSDIKKIKKELEKSKKDLESYVEKLDSNLLSVTQKIEELSNVILEKEEEIRVTSKELEDAVNLEESQYEAMKVRIQFMYEQGDDFYLEAIWGADSFGDILNRADYFEELASYDRRQLDEYILNRQMIEMCKEQLEAQKEVLDEAKSIQEEEEKNLENLIGMKEKEIVSYQTDINNKEQAIQEYEADIAARTELIAALEKAVADEKRKIMEENGEVIQYDGGVFQWPVPAYTRISSDYGNRVHPTLGVVLFHNGVDMAAPTGSKILAAYDGKVIAADYSNTMGNYAMIDHGDGLFTVYMHASQLHVSRGDIVIRGEHIADVGSTGRSTGPHLHFSVRLNGVYVSPWNYLSE